MNVWMVLDGTAELIVTGASSENVALSDGMPRSLSAETCGIFFDQNSVSGMFLNSDLY